MAHATMPATTRYGGNEKTRENQQLNDGAAELIGQTRR